MSYNYLEGNLQALDDITEVVITQLYRLQMTALLGDVYRAIQADPKIGQYPRSQTVVIHKDFVYYNSLALYRVNTNLHIDNVTIRVTVEDFIDPKDFVTASLAYHDMYEIYRPIEMFLKRYISWLARNIKTHRLTETLMLLMPTELIKWAKDYHNSPIAPLGTVEANLLLEYQQRHKAYFTRFNTYVFIGSI